MRYFFLILLALGSGIPSVIAVTPAEDIATTILLRGYECGGKQVHDIDERQDDRGNQIIRATCPNGTRYQLEISSGGRVSVKPLR